MSFTIQLIDVYKKELHLRSDSAMADSLGVSRATLSRWRKGNGHPEPGLAWKIAEAIGENPAEIMVNIECERATNLENAQAWQRVRNMYIMSNIAAHMRRKRLVMQSRNRI